MIEPAAKKENSPRIEQTIEYGRQLWQARYSHCGKFLIAAGYDAKVHRWDVQQTPARQLAPLEGFHGWVQALAVHPTQPRLFAADSWGRLGSWQYDQPESVSHWCHQAAHPSWIRDLAISGDGRWLASCGSDRVVRVWAAETGKLQCQLKEHAGTVFSVRFHPQANEALVSGELDGTIRHWDWRTGKLVRTLDASDLYQLHRIQHCGGARLLRFDAQGERLACGGQKQPQGGFANGFPAVLLFDWESGDLAYTSQVGSNSDGFVYDAQFHPDGFWMATACAFPGKGRLWFVRPGEPKPFFQSPKLTNGRSLSLHPDRQQLAMLVSTSANANGRPLKDGKYLGGTAKIHLLRLAQG